MASLRRVGHPAMCLAVAFALFSSTTRAVSAEGERAHAVSHADPYRTCADPGFAAPGESSHLDTEVEPQVAVDPAHGDHRIALWMQDDWSGGLGARGLAGAYTRDGGHDWHQFEMPFSRCARGGLAVDRAADPWVSFGGDGTAYASAALLGFSSDPSAATTGVAVATSRDGGATWTHVHELILDTATARFYDDKPSLTADPRIPGTAYAVWDRTSCPNDCAVTFNGTFTQPALFSKTTDYGATWSRPRVIVPTEPDHYTIGNVIVVDPRDGTLYDAFAYDSAPTFTGFEEMTRSTDGGRTWSNPRRVGVDDHVGVTDPTTGRSIRSGSGIPSFALDRARDRDHPTLYVAWESSQFSGGAYNEVALASSADGGTTWSTRRANRPTGGPAFTPVVAVATDGSVGVTYYDIRNRVAGDTTRLATNVWLTTSPRGGRHFGDERDILGTSFNMLAAPDSGGLFLGDYQGLAVAGETFVPAFAAVHSGDGDDPTNIYGGAVDEGGDRTGVAG